MFFDVLGAFRRDVAQVAGRGCCRKHKSQRNDREDQPGDAGRHKHVVHVGNVEAEDVERHMFEGLDVLKDREGEQEEENRQRGQHRKRNIQAAVELQPRAAVAAVGKVLFIVPSHLGRNPGDVISPARQDGAYDVIIASGSSHSFITHL
jgi:hypothetical protein